MREFLRKFYTQSWQRWMWLASLAKGEIYKPLLLLNETLLITTFCATVLGFRPNLKEILFTYLFLLLLFIIGGYLYLQSGAAKYNATISNEQNPQFMQMVRMVEDLTKKINELEQVIKTKQ